MVAGCKGWGWLGGAVYSLVLGSAACAQLPKVEHGRLGVDRLQLTTGERVYGFALGSDESGQMRFAVERTWLETTHPKVFQQALMAEAVSADLAQKQLTDRVEAWIDRRGEDERLVKFLRYQLDKSQRVPQRPQDPAQFIVLHLEVDAVREWTPAPASQRRMAGLAYEHGVPNVVLTPASLLHKQLETLGVQVENEQVDLRERLPQTVTFSDAQWSAKVSLVEYQMRKPLEFQGTGNRMLRVGEQRDAAELLGSLLAGKGMDSVTQLGAELGLPEFQQFQRDHEDWWREPTRIAEQEGYRGVLITRLDQSLWKSQVSVETRFMAQLPSGEWIPVFTLQVQADAQQQAEADVQRLKQDPQLQQVLQTLSTLGLDASGQLDQALRHGAATQAALTEAKGAFHLFLGQHSDRLDGPQLPLPHER